MKFTPVLRRVFLFVLLPLLLFPVIAVISFELYRFVKIDMQPIRKEAILTWNDEQIRVTAANFWNSRHKDVYGEVANSVLIRGTITVENPNRRWSKADLTCIKASAPQLPDSEIFNEDLTAYLAFSNPVKEGKNRYFVYWVFEGANSLSDLDYASLNFEIEEDCALLK